MDFNELTGRVRTQVVKKYGGELLGSGAQVAEAIRREVRAITGKEDKELEDRVVACLIGLGPVDPFLYDETVNEIMINGPDTVYVERNGRLEKTEAKFASEEDVVNIVYRIVQQCGRRINFSEPLVNARLPDGSRLNAVIPPASQYPVVTIRKFVRKAFTTEELIRQRFLSSEMATFFRAAVTGKANVVVAGAAGSGKTTFLRWLAGFIPPSERIITIEDTRELALNHPHVISLEASEKADIYDLMINSLRMRPDRIILGEVRGAEAFELLQAMGTGHEGSLTTVHANYGKMQAVHRLVRAMLRVGGVTPEELTAMIAETIDILVFVKRFSDGRRRLLHVSQVTSDEGRPVFRDLYRYRFQDDTHVAVGTVTAELAERLAENLEGQLPDIKALRGEMVA